MQVKPAELDENDGALRKQLKIVTPTIDDHETYFKVPWSMVPDLVEKRKVLLKGGMAYVPQREQMSLVLQAFQERLERGLEVRFPRVMIKRTWQADKTGPGILLANG